MTILADSGISEGVFALVGALVGAIAAFAGTYYQMSRARRERRYDELAKMFSEISTVSAMMKIGLESDEHSEFWGGADGFKQRMVSMATVGSHLLYLLSPDDPQERAVTESIKKLLSVSIRKDVSIREASAEFDRVSRALLASHRRGW